MAFGRTVAVVYVVGDPVGDWQEIPSRCGVAGLTVLFVVLAVYVPIAVVERANPDLITLRIH
jgi:hypothetical protein